MATMATTPQSISTTQTYVQFTLTPYDRGAYNGGPKKPQETLKVEKRDANSIIAQLELRNRTAKPEDKVFRFRFLDLDPQKEYHYTPPKQKPLEAEDSHQWTLGGKLVSPENFSAWYYLTGKEMELSEVEKMPEPKNIILAENMRDKGVNRVLIIDGFIESCNTYMLRDNDVVLPSANKPEALARK